MSLLQAGGPRDGLVDRMQRQLQLVLVACGVSWWSSRPLTTGVAHSAESRARPCPPPLSAGALTLRPCVWLAAPGSRVEKFRGRPAVPAYHATPIACRTRHPDAE